MADSSPSLFSTPKRKRSDIVIDNVSAPSYTHFSFEVDAPGTPTAGGSSPRSRVEHRFRGLALNDSGGGHGGVVAADGPRPQLGPAVTHDLDPVERMEIDEDESKMRKRTRLSPCPTTATTDTPQSQEANAREPPETPAVQDNNSTVAAPQPDDQPRFAPIDEPAPSSNQHDAVTNIAIDQSLVARSPVASPAELPKTQASSSNRPIEALRQKSRKRAGTPPLTAQRNKTGSNTHSGDVPSEIVDPVRAALTWHDDEITVYDPDDEDDDGVGINGIGFKPTPAIAYARTMKKRQQLAEYRKREEREARARRSHRRRGSPEKPSPPKMERKDTARKVRFTEADPSMMIETI